MYKKQYATRERNMANEKKKWNSIAASGDENDLGDVWTMIMVKIVLCEVKAEISSKVKQIKTVYTYLKEGWWRIGERMHNLWG